MPLDTKPDAPEFAPTFARPRKVTFADGQVIYSSWYEHPYRTGSGKLRSYEDTLRLARKAANCE